MKTLYFECSMGAAGDMLTGALLELCPDPDAFVDKLNHLGIPGIVYHASRIEKGGITGTSMSVFINDVLEERGDMPSGQEEGSHHGHEHHSLADIDQIISAMQIPQSVRDDITAVYRLIADAEGHVHGRPVDQIHFHEVGTMDAVADITAVCLLIHELAPEKITASSIHVGSGHIECAHGILPVPAPATAYILQDVPTYGGEVQGELCTPTGAALLKHFAQDFGHQPAMRVEKIGYGCGKKEFDQVNCVRAFLGETD